MASCNESESEGSMPDLEELEPLRPSEPPVSPSKGFISENNFLVCYCVMKQINTEYHKTTWAYNKKDTQN